MKYFLVLLFLVSTLYGFDIDIYNSTIANGKTAMIEFKKEKSVSYDKILAGKKSYKIYQHPTNSRKMYVLLPINYYEKPSDQKVEILYKEDEKEMSKTVFFRIEDGKYKKEAIKVQKSKVNPTAKKVKERISKEYAEAMKIYATCTDESYVDSKFIAPMDSKITSAFGKARVYNDSLKGYHSGTDYRAKIGTPIKASNDGVVVLVKDRFYAGGTVILNHGRGIYTCYYHMSKFDVEMGQKVAKAEIIGLSGDTGRVTGPHLHFSARVGGEQVDPLQLIQLLNAKLF
ncbi:MAG: M23 family metallopeptidase [Campylobacterota bacterium]|nr:M23 family metallopeptidase [Campylobacterota bacterium]